MGIFILFHHRILIRQHIVTQQYIKNKNIKISSVVKSYFKSFQAESSLIEKVPELLSGFIFWYFP
jgi:hypothetical protein